MTEMEKPPSAASGAAKPATLTDVAEAAGVAIGTASRVLNNFKGVGHEARQRVLDAVTRLNYRPLRQRSPALGSHAIRESRSHSVGLVLLGMAESLVHVPVLSEMLHGIESSITEKNGSLLLANLPQADRVPAFIKTNQVEGLIIKTSQYNELPSAEENPLIRSLMRFPLVWVWGKPERARGDLCSFNHESAAILAAGFLAGKGHKCVAYLNPKKGKSSLEHLKKEFSHACGVAGLELTLLESSTRQISTWPEPALTGPHEILPLVDSWLAIERRKRPTAIFVPADNIAIHLYAALEKRGLTVGTDVSVVSCNNERSLIRALKPSLTTIEVNAREIGRRAVSQLLWRIAHPADAHTQTILLEPTLREGDSVATI